MGKKFLIGVIATLSLSTIAAAATPYDLKDNMHKLNNYMKAMQVAFIEGDKQKALQAAEALGLESQKLLGDEAIMRNMLPKDKAHKARIATTSAHLISDNVDIIKSSMDNVRRETAQNAYLDIQRACMRCHNLVRDW
ncbi:MAG: hypothetical protein Q8M43_00190 [Sulfuricurvum sp.]|jgi:hypothetical protein|uniref:hypothetical protein n=1 Tax=Sulfuricurvum sp. TaxID=2025608 RepID=UPI00272876C9|nr:hypothetical protein [Sulfuricurvum sp.]MDO9056086.1 hypothetical protein [Sulfuricurvum sp.]MDP3290431.1 hypothetical protein [Sulfuricurvum sp.]